MAELSCLVGAHGIVVRAEVAGDWDGVRAVHLASFPTGAEAALVDSLRAAGRLVVSLVAVDSGDGGMAATGGGPRSPSADGSIVTDSISVTADGRDARSVGAAAEADGESAALTLTNPDEGPVRRHFVRDRGERVVGHVAFSPVTADGLARGVGLAPVAVLPAYRERGVAARLIRDGLRACAEIGCRFVVVLGEPRYYGRFGFQPASRWGLRDEYGGGDAFQALELQAGALGGAVTLVRYAPEFAALPS
jgi:putative acetyltransferase